MKALKLHLALFALLITVGAVTAQNNLEIHQLGQIYNNWDRVRAIEFRDDLCYLSTGTTGIQILDLADPTQPEIVGNFDHFHGSVRDLEIVGDLLYLTDGPGILILDISDPLVPVEISRTPVDEYLYALTVVDGIVYAVDEYGIHLYNAEDPEELVALGANHEPDYSTDVDVRNGFAYVTAKNRLYIIDVLNPDNPETVGFIHSEHRIFTTEIIGTTAYSVGDGAFQMIDVSIPDQPVRFGFYEEGMSISGFSIQGDRVWLTEFEGLMQQIDISDPGNIELIEEHEFDYSINTMVIRGDFFYLSEPTLWGDIGGAFHVVDATAAGVFDEVACLARDGYVYDVALQDDFAYVANSDGGLRIVDVSDPEDPTEIYNLDLQGRVQGVTVVGNTAYVCALEGGLFVVDITDPEEPIINGQFAPEGMEFFNVAIEDDFAYVAAGDHGLRIVDISDPTNMSQLGRAHLNDYAKDVVIDGNIAYVAIEHGGLSQVDISDPRRPRTMRGVRFQNGGVVQMEKNDNYLFLACKNQGLMIYDVSNPDQLECVSIIECPGDVSDVTVIGDYAYLANLFNGLHVYDVSDPAAPVAVASYDTPGRAYGIAADGEKILLADYSSLRLFELAEIQGILQRTTFTSTDPQVIAAYPNPFNCVVTISYGLAAPVEMSLELVNPLGQTVKSLYSGYQSAGNHKLALNAIELPSGVYYTRLTTPKAISTQKITLIR